MSMHVTFQQEFHHVKIDLDIASPVNKETFTRLHCYSHHHHRRRRRRRRHHHYYYYFMMQFISLSTEDDDVRRETALHY